MKRLIFVGALLASLCALVTTASASRTTTYHGVFSGPVVYTGCTTTPPQAIASGTWNVALHGSTDATVTVNIFVDGKHHVAYGGTFPQLTAQDGQTFAVSIPTAAGPLVVSLTGHTFTYEIAPYSAFGMSCQSVVYAGTLSG